MDNKWGSSDIWQSNLIDAMCVRHRMVNVSNRWRYRWQQVWLVFVFFFFVVTLSFYNAHLLYFQFFLALYISRYLVIYVLLCYVNF